MSSDIGLGEILTLRHHPAIKPKMSDTVADRYLEILQSVLQQIRSTQSAAIEAAAVVCADAIASGGLVHVFGSGHSRMIVEEIWPRYGSFPGFHPIVELSLTAHHQVTGANGQRQAMFIERVPGLAAQIARNFHFGEQDALIAVSSGGTSVVTVELAELLHERGMPVIAITAREHSALSAPQAPSGRRLMDCWCSEEPRGWSPPLPAGW